MDELVSEWNNYKGKATILRKLVWLRVDQQSGVLLICFLLSFLYLLFCTKSSPLYPFNDWVDANAFFTMGKGMMHGLVPYRDLFEQKGPLLYLIYGVASLISFKTFLGGFIFEVIAFTYFLFYSYKSLTLFIEKQIALIILPFMAILILNMKAFTHGGSAEELCLPLIAISLYHLLRLLRKDDFAFVDGKVFFWNGVIAGCILWIKFSLLGFWLGWILTLFIILVKKSQLGLAFKGVTTFIGGVILATLPWIVYFGINHAIPDWINTYFIINLKGYSSNLTLFGRSLLVLQFLATHIFLNPITSSFLWVGIVALVIFPKFIPSKTNRISFLMCISLLIISVFGGGRGYVYYYLVFAPFVILGFIVLRDVIAFGGKRPISNRAITVSIAAIMVISLPLIYRFNQNAYMLHVDREDLVQYKFASIINQLPDPTLLNYGVLDMGFYTTSGIIPNVKYFELQNLDYDRYPMNLDEQNRYISEGVTEFVVIIHSGLMPNGHRDIPFLSTHYQIIASADQFFEGNNFTYYLFQRVE